MHEQQPVPADDSLEPEKTGQSNMVPYERFAEVNRQLKELRSRLAEMQTSRKEEDQQKVDPAAVKEDIFKRLVENPEDYLSELMSRVSQHEIQLMKEEIELQSALKFARQKHPEFKEFEKYVLQEIMELVDKNPEIEKLSWEDIIDKGFDQLQSKFKSAVKQNPDQFIIDSADEVKKAFMEGNVSRKPQPLPASFTREEIARMSMQDFLKNEAAINEALKNQRIR